MNLAFNTPFDKQLAFFRQKLNLPTERWDDLMKAAHDRAFIVAGAQKADLLADLNRAVAKSIEHGFGLEEFRRDFSQIVHNSGWSGWTGEGTKAGEAWRTKVIYQTNLATSYAAGRYRQLTDPAFLKLRPYWQYVHDDSVTSPRPEHQALDGLTLPHDHPFWQSGFPPNGWGCGCRVVPVAAPQQGDATQPPDGWDARDGAGNLPGVDRGFDYAPGASNAEALRALVDAKVANLPEPLGQALAEDVTATIASMKANEIANNLALLATGDNVLSKFESIWVSEQSLRKHVEKRVAAGHVSDEEDYARKTFEVLCRATTMTLVEPAISALRTTAKVQVVDAGWVVLLSESGQVVTSYPFNPDKVTFEQRHKQMGDKVYEQTIDRQYRDALKRIFGTR